MSDAKELKNTCPYCNSDNILKIAVINGKNRYICKNGSCINKTKSGNNKTFYLEKKMKVECPRCKSTNTQKNGFGKDNNIRYRCKDCEKKEKEKSKESRNPYWFYENQIKIKEPIDTIIDTPIDTIISPNIKELHKEQSKEDDILLEF